MLKIEAIDKLLFGLFIGLILGMFAGSIVVNKDISKQLVERGYKQYDQKTGKLEWVEDNKEND